MINFRTIGLISILALLIFILFVPLIVTIVVGMGFANLFGFTGIYWWAFVILFYLIISALFMMIGI